MSVGTLEIAERYVLGGILADPQTIAVVDEIVTADDFADHRHATIFRAALDLSRTGTFDVVTVTERLEAEGSAGRVGGLPFVGGLAADVVSTAAIARHARIVSDAAAARRVAAVGLRLQAATGSTWQERVNDAMRDLSGVGRTSTSADCDIDDAITAAVDEIVLASEGMVGVPSGLDRLDRRTGGLHAGDLIVVGARTSVGKTALMLRFVLGANVPVGIVSSEQPRTQIAMRLLAMQAPANLRDLRTGKLDDEARKRVDRAASQLRQRTIKINDRARPSVAEIRRQARAWQQRHGIEALFIDYLQRLRPEDANRPRHEQVGEIAISLKEMARDLDVPVIVLAQLNREVESRNDRTPRLSDLRDSGQIEQEADLVMLLHRNSDDDSNATLDVAKNRNGPTGYVQLVWKAWCTRYDDDQSR